VQPLAFETAVRTRAGPAREHNEDAILATPRLVAIADGVGGGSAGEVASGTVITALAHLEKCHPSVPLASAITEAVAQGNERIGFIAECRPATRGMGTTVTAVALDEAYTVANIGDSRTYLLRDGELAQLTHDDSFVQALVDSGHLDPESARNHPQRSVVLAALDGDPERLPAVDVRPARAGDRLLLCSDGLSDVVEDNDLREALAIPSRELCAERLIELAAAAGARDDVSVIVADVVPADPDRTW
jgi:protein phosphatase